MDNAYAARLGTSAEASPIRSDPPDLPHSSRFRIKINFMQVTAKSSSNSLSMPVPGSITPSVITSTVNLAWSTFARWRSGLPPLSNSRTCYASGSLRHGGT